VYSHEAPPEPVIGSYQAPGKTFESAFIVKDGIENFRAAPARWVPWGGV